MTDGTGEVRSELLPRGQAMRSMLLWLSERRREDPAAPRLKLIGEASLRFDLTPAETEFLLRAWDPG
ncbi:hypothetical protein [Anaeromyxobacter paludicola]|nr:hypothetical protein [Anaeromyxobacter paludicola]